MHDQRPEFGVYPGRADRSAVPSGPLALDRLRDGGNTSIVIGARVPGSTLLDARLSVRRQLALHFFDDERKAGFGIGLDGRSAGSAAAAAATSAAAGDAAKADIVVVSLRSDFRQPRAGDGGLRATRLQTERIVVSRVRARTAERMALRETHGAVGRGGTGAGSY